MRAETFVVALLMVPLWSQIPTDSLVAHYPFNGNANDESGNGNDGTVNGATLAADRFGNASRAYSFDGGSHIATSSQLPVNNDVGSISVWINPSYNSGAVTRKGILHLGSGISSSYRIDDY